MEPKYIPLKTDIKAKSRFPIGFFDQFLTHKREEDFKTVEQEGNNNLNSNFFKKKNEETNYFKQRIYFNYQSISLELKPNKKKLIDFSQFYNKAHPNTKRQRLFNLKAKDNIQKIQQKQREKEMRKRTLSQKSQSSQHFTKTFEKIHSTKCTFCPHKEISLLNQTSKEIKLTKSKTSFHTCNNFNVNPITRQPLGRQKYFNFDDMRNLTSKTTVKSDNNDNIKTIHFALIDKLKPVEDKSGENFKTYAKPKVEYIKNKYKCIFEMYEKNKLA